MEFFSKDLSPVALLHVLYMGFFVLAGDLLYLPVRYLFPKEKAAAFRQNQLAARYRRFFTTS